MHTGMRASYPARALQRALHQQLAVTACGNGPQCMRPSPTWLCYVDALCQSSALAGWGRPGLCSLFLSGSRATVPVAGVLCPALCPWANAEKIMYVYRRKTLPTSTRLGGRSVHQRRYVRFERYCFCSMPLAARRVRRVLERLASPPRSTPYVKSDSIAHQVKPV